MKIAKSIARVSLAAVAAVSLACGVVAAQTAHAYNNPILPNAGKAVSWSSLPGTCHYGFYDPSYNADSSDVVKKCKLKGSTLVVRATFIKCGSGNGNRTKLTTKKFKLAKKVKLYHSEDDTLFYHGSFKHATTMKYLKRWYKMYGAYLFEKNGKVVAAKPGN